ncbi:hypothetical protein HN873_008103, partial [Arachis hypogaea]
PVFQFYLLIFFPPIGCVLVTPFAPEPPFTTFALGTFLAAGPHFALGLLAFGPLMGCRVRPGVGINCWNLSLKEELAAFIVSELTIG